MSEIFRTCLIICFSIFLASSASAQTQQERTSGRNAQKGSTAAKRAEKKKPAPKKIAKPNKNEEDEEDDEDENNILDREKWFYEQRAYPNKHIPAGARLRAFEHVRKMEAAEAVERARLARSATRDLQPAAPSAPVSGGKSIAANTQTWTPIGPRPINSGGSVGFTSGRLSAIAVDPTDANVVFAGGAQGGVWRSTDGGANWTPLTDDQATLAIGSLAIDPSSCSAGPPIPCKTVYAGTGEATNSADSYYGAGVLKSVDGGNTWTQLSGTITNPTLNGPTSFVGPFSGGFSPGGGARIASLAVHPTNPLTLLAGVILFQSVDTGSSSGIYRSTDGGQTWTRAVDHFGSGAACNKVFFDPANGNIAYAALGSNVSPSDPDSGIYRSADGGITWTKMPGTGINVLPTADVGRVEMSVAPSQTNIIYVGMTSVSTSGLLGFFKSIDGGQNWTRLSGTPDYCTAQCWYDHVIRVHPTDPNVVFIGGSAVTNRLIRTTDGGNTWTPITVGANGVTPHVDLQSMAFSTPVSGAVRLYLGNDGGLWSTNLAASTSAVNWSNLNQGLQLTQYYPGISIDPTTIDRGFGGSQDNGTHMYSGILQWDEVTCGDGGYTAIDTANPSIVYAACQRIAIRKSTSGGLTGTFVSAQTGINTGDAVSFIPPLVMDPNPGMSNRLYFGTSRVWRTTNGADPNSPASWVDISSSSSGLSGATIRTIAVAPGNSDVVYVGLADGSIFRTINAGAGIASTWTSVTGSGLPARTVTMIAVDPFDATGNTVYVGFSGFGGSGSNFTDILGHIFKANFAIGNNWTDVSGSGVTGFPNTPVNAIVVDPDVPGTILAGTDVGVFVSNDGGLDWSTFNQNSLPRVAVFDLKLHRASRTLRAATHGRGMWDIVLTNFNSTFNLQSVSPTGTAVGSNGLPLIVTGVGFTNNSAVQWNGSARPTTFVSSTQLSAFISTADLATGGYIQITVFDPAQVSSANLAGTTNFLIFNITNPVPALANIAPTNFPNPPAAAGITLTANGSNFSGNSVVLWGGSPRPTTFVNSNQLTAAIPASDLVAPGLVNVTVSNPPPGGGVTAAKPFIIGVPPPNDDFANATIVTSANFTDTVNNAAATTATTDPFPPCALGSNFHSLWYSFTPAGPGTAIVDTAGSSYDTVLSVWIGGPGSFGAITCDDDSVAVAGASRINMTFAAGVTYFFMVSGFSPTDFGTTRFNLAATIQPPTIASLSPGSGLLGGPAFTLSVSGTGFGTNSTVLWNNSARPTTFGNSPLLTAAIPSSDIASPGTALITVQNVGVGGAVSTPANFSISSASLSATPASVTVLRGQSAIYNLTANFASVPSSAVTLSCTGLPGLASCNFNPVSPPPGPNPINATLSIITTAPSSLFPIARWRMPMPQTYFYLALIALLCCMWIAARGIRESNSRWAYVAIIALAIASSVVLVSCGGGGGGGGQIVPPVSNPGTPVGTYQVTVTVTSGASSGSTVVTLIVQ